ncbi:MAG: TetR/AcrR family transcriptional regulator [Chloroflexi bacterium]|nr:TetR/AcrR family transcriptional regulator [Chloroflexota bacterium]
MENRQLTTRRERRTAIRRAQILEAAARVFAEKGYHETTTREIADAADLSEGTIYIYFESKADLLFGILDRLAALEQRDKHLETGLQETARDFFIAHFRDRTERLQPQMDKILAILPQVFIDPELRERYYQSIVVPNISLLEGHLQTRIEMGQLKSVDIRLATRILVGAMIGLGILTNLGDPVVKAAWAKPEELAEALATVLVDGLTS